MLYRCLADFLETLAQAGELLRIDEPVDTNLRLSEFVRQRAESNRSALLFASPGGSHVPVLANLLASEARICRALDATALDEVASRVARPLESHAAANWFERLKGSAQPAAIQTASPREVRSAACQQIIRLGSDIDLGELPLLQVAPDIPPAIHSAIVLTAEPDTHQPIAGRFDLQPLDAHRLTVCWADHDEHTRLLGDYRARSQKMPIAVVIGGDPAYLLAAAAPLEARTDLAALAGVLREKPLDVVACRSVDLRVPAESEIVIEGFIDPTAPLAAAGPLCAPLGHATTPRPAPVMQVTALTHRANPLYATMVPGRPPHEASTIARAMQRVFLPLTRLAMPDLVDYDLPEFAAARHWVAVSIRKTYPGQAHRAAHAAWNLPAVRFAKTLVVVDADVDVRNHEAVLAAIARHVNPATDLLTERGPADPFDPATPSNTLGCRMAFDATGKLPGECGGIQTSYHFV